VSRAAVVAGDIWCDVSAGVQHRQFVADGFDDIDWFVVDDAIVVMKYYAYLEKGVKPAQAALLGAKQMVSPSVDEHFTHRRIYPILLMASCWSALS